MNQYSESRPHVERYLNRTEAILIFCAKQLANPDPELYDDELWDLAKGNCSYYRSAEAALIPRFSGSLSSVSSMFIIYIILYKTSAKLSSIYHRIMFGLSISDILTSTAMALSTLPMPAPGTNQWADMNRIEGTRIGNTQTCAAQGFFYEYGITSVVCYSVSLSFFYLCTIGFKLKHKTMRRCVEPFLHLIPAAVAIWFSVPYLFAGGYNTGFTPWCMVTPEPNFCQNTDKYECERGASVDSVSYLQRKSMIFSLSIVLCLLFLAILCCKVFQSERRLVVAQRQGNLVTRLRIRRGPDSPDGRIVTIRGDDNSEDYYVRGDASDRIKATHKLTRVILLQAFLYVAAYLLSLLFSALDLAREGELYQIQILTFGPLQGFFTFLIFIFHKVYNKKRTDPSLSTYKALCDIFVHGEADDTFLMTRMHLVSIDNARREQQYVVSFCEEEEDEISAHRNEGEGDEEKLEEEKDCESERKEQDSGTPSGTIMNHTSDSFTSPSGTSGLDVSSVFSIQTPSLLSGNISGFDEVSFERSAP